MATFPSARRLSLAATTFALLAASAACADRNALGPVSVGSIPRADDGAFGLGSLAQVPSPLGFTSIAGGFLHSCAVQSDAPVVQCWGKNGNGQLGNGSLVDASLPATVSGGVSFAAVSAGGEHSCALSVELDVYCWGLNWNGQVGDNSMTNRSVPTRLAGGLKFRSVAAGLMHSCALTLAGEAYCWGGNASGQLGDGTTTSSLTPVRVGGGVAFTDLEAGRVHTCGITKTGAIYCWGDNRGGQIGDGFVGVANNRLLPVRVPVPASKGLNAGSFFTCSVANGGQVYCWGANDRGQIGVGDTSTFITSPTSVTGVSKIAAVSGGAMHTCAVAAAGSMYCWGDNRYGQLGDGSTTTSRVPVIAANGALFTAVAVGYYHSCGRSASGSVSCWGFNSNGQLGDGSTVNSASPVLLGSGGASFAQLGGEMKLN